jgi:hypothetical protein
MRNKGISIAGITGRLEFRKNGTMAGIFNQSAAPGTAASNEIYDTIDDYANNSGQVVLTPFGTDYLASTTQWQIIAPGGGAGTSADCDAGTDDCVYKDLNTRLMWTEQNAQPGLPIDTSIGMSHVNALAFCSGLTFAGMTGWRVPTQKELMQAYVDGFGNVGKANPFFADVVDLSVYPVWSSSDVSSDAATNNTALRWRGNLVTGATHGIRQDTITEWICVR